MVQNNSHEVEGGRAPESTSIVTYLKFGGEVTVVVFYTVWVFISRIFMCCFRGKAKSLKDEIILVTGGANGIGLEICRKIVDVEPFVTIVIWDVDAARTAEAVKELEGRGIYKAYGDILDVSNRELVQKAAQKIREQCGEVTILFNNAGIAGGTCEGWKMDSKLIEKVFQVNLISHCWTIQEFLPPMVKLGRGHIIETCSFLGIIWGAGGSAYVATKHGLKAYIECIKEDVRNLPEKPKINFSIAYPQNTLTAMTAKVNFKSKKYPFLVNQLSPQDVASKMVEGMLRNEEHIYIPGNLRMFPALFGIIPPEIIRRIADISKIDFDKSPTVESSGDGSSPAPVSNTVSISEVPPKIKQ